MQMLGTANFSNQTNDDLIENVNFCLHKLHTHV